MEKIAEFMGQQKEVYQKELGENGSEFFSGLSDHGKLSRGENYLGLPYLILDYPAKFQQDGILAIRTMFWWGNFFSITLHISGNRLPGMNRINLLQGFAEREFYCCVSDDEWQHHFDASNYLKHPELNRSSLTKLYDRPFLKVAKKFSLEDFTILPKKLTNAFREILEVTNVNWQRNA